jgi:hypothetical protein
MSEEQKLTPEWLMKHGFEWLTDDNTPPAFDVEIDSSWDNSQVRLLIEKGIHRNQFCIAMEQCKYTDGSVWYDTAIWMQDNIGCGFSQIPDPIISEWTVERFGALYFSLRDEYLFLENDVYDTICTMLAAHGYKRTASGDMVRQSTGCSFGREYLLKYQTVTDFQLDWPYSL